MHALFILVELADAKAFGELSSLVSDLLKEVKAEGVPTDSEYDQLKDDFDRVVRLKNDLQAEVNTLQFELAKHRVDGLAGKLFSLRNNPSIMSGFKELLKTQGKIPAIKYIRSVSSLGLKEAKDFMDECIIQMKLPWKGMENQQTGGDWGSF